MSEKLILGAALLVPLLLIAFVLPRVGDFLGGSDTTPTPEVLGVLAGPTGSPTAVPATSPGATSASPTAAQAAKPTATTGPTATPAPTPVRGASPASAALAPTPWSEATPDGAVRDFYALVAQHQFAAAARLWSPAMAASYPPSEYIDARFARTQRIVVNSTQVTSVDDAAGRAMVKVDITEVTSASASPRHLAGSWSLVRDSNGWLLDQPSFP